jgi:hypothetical protein
MSILEIREARKEDRYLRMVLDGISGSGKTFTALTIGSALAKKMGGDICVVDSEGGSSADYANLFQFKVARFGPPYTPERYIAAMQEIQKAGFALAIIDSFSHLWSGAGGELEMVDSMDERDKFSKGWRKVTPKHNKVLTEILNIEMGIIGTLRTKTEYVIEKDDRGKNIPRKLGTKPVMRDQFEYEFQLAGSMYSSNMTITKSRMHGVAGEGELIEKPGADFAEKIWSWLHPGEGSYRPVVEKVEVADPAPASLSPSDFSSEEKKLIAAKYPHINNAASLRMQFPGMTKEQVLQEVTQ